MRRTTPRFLTALVSVSLSMVISLVAFSTRSSSGQRAIAGQGTPQAQRLAQMVRALPLSFEPNRGQASSDILFLARLKDAPLLLRRGGISLPLTRLGAASTSSSSVDMQFVGANASAQIAGEQRLPGTTSYFIGNDPSLWHANIPTYGAVVYRDLYHGIDATIRGSAGRLEYDFIVQPGADPTIIVMHFPGATSIRVDPQGELIVQTKDGVLTQAPPLLYQTIGSARRDVPGRFEIRGHDVGFAVGSYDPGLALTIDPVLAYSTYLGGSAYDASVSITLDASGNIYLAGDTKSLNFPLVGAFQTQYAGGPFDAFVTKLNPSGSAIVYSSYLGGTSYDRANGIAVDASGDAFVGGRADSRNFPVVKPIQATSGGGADSFVSEVSPSGSSLLFSTYLGGSGFDRVNAVALGAGGVVWATGRTNSLNFPTVNPIQPANGGGTFDAWVAKLDPTTPTLLFSTYLGGIRFDGGNGIAVDASGNAYATGRTSSNNFPTVNPIQGYKGRIDVWLAKIAPDGSSLLYSTYIGGTADDRGVDVKVDGSGNAYVTGRTDSTDFPTKAAPSATVGASRRATLDPFEGFDAFVLKMNATGSALVYSFRFGGTNHEEGEGIALDASGDAFVVGGTYSTDFPVLNAVQPTFAGVEDAYAMEVGPTGSIIYATYLGGSGQDIATSVAVNASGGAFLSGFTASTDFPTVNPVQAQNAGNDDAFVSEITN
jgi:hypothetical protein